MICLAVKSTSEKSFPAKSDFLEVLMYKIPPNNHLNRWGSFHKSSTLHSEVALKKVSWSFPQRSQNMGKNTHRVQVGTQIVLVGFLERYFFMFHRILVMFYFYSLFMLVFNSGLKFDIVFCLHCWVICCTFSRTKSRLLFYIFLSAFFWPR